MWGCNDCCGSEEALLEILGVTNLGILNAGSKPTFRNSVGEEILDVSLALGRVGIRIRSRKISEEISMSDHRHITFELIDVKPEMMF